MTRLDPIRALLLAGLVAGCAPPADPRVAGDGGPEAGPAGDGGPEAGPAGDGGPDGGARAPTAADIRFEPGNDVPGGEQLLFHDFSSPSGPVVAIRSDGAGETELFRAYMTLAFDRLPGGTVVAFVCGFALGSAGPPSDVPGTYHAWRYDYETARLDPVGFDGTASDRCVALAPRANVLYTCRAAGCDAAGTCEPARVAQVDLATGGVSFLTPPGQPIVAIAPTPDGASLFLVRAQLPADTAGALVRLDLASGSTAEVRDRVAMPRVARDGRRLLFRDEADGERAATVALDGSDPVRVTAVPVLAATYSPDGARVAYVPRTACAIEIVAADGSEAATPTRIRDCAATGEQITDLLWTGP